ncbi:MSHA pilin protein MshA [Massilia sp. MP_M2]|uniref:type II secretion system protein n=1 Tax=Massilia sp. MP_M2 TaxID=3071713 RepID=UPI00319D8E72
MNKGFNKAAQAGFTLIELIVVIVILGILAATALPKFTGLSGDARKASLQAARGALSASSAMLHGRALVAPNETAFTVEGGTSVGITNGYPAATEAFATAAGLGDDYKATATGGVLKIEPKNIPTSMTNCFITYTPPSGAGGVPTLSTLQGVTCD